MVFFSLGFFFLTGPSTQSLKITGEKPLENHAYVGELIAPKAVPWSYINQGKV